ncbi:hypothetical protein Trydic_g14028 [Trypoxylus dichotomus]
MDLQAFFEDEVALNPEVVTSLSEAPIAAIYEAGSQLSYDKKRVSRMPGRVHYARVFPSSELYIRISEGNQFIPDNMHLVGDSAYPLLPKRYGAFS